MSRKFQPDPTRTHPTLYMDFRLDRLATLYVMSPGLRLMPRRGLFVPILMYHSVSDIDESHAHAYYRTTTSPALFTAQMKCLHAEGYATCTLAQALEHLQAGTQVGKRHVVITFDDGYRDFYQHAAPLLNNYGFSATVFLPTSYIGESPISFKGKDCLTWAEIRELGKVGITFGSHTVTHPQLYGLPIPDIRKEVVRSKQTIEQNVGFSISSFSYPYAFPETDATFKADLRQVLAEAGYANGVCTTVGRACSSSDRFFLNRLPVNSADDDALFQAKLNGGYDWLAKPQYLLKMAKRWPPAKPRPHLATTA